MQIAVESYKNDGVSFTDWFLDNYEILLKMEKEQMFHSFYAGGGVAVFQEYEDEFTEYYNQTYNQDRELPKDVKDMLNNL